MSALPAKDLDHIVSRTRGLWEPLRGQSIFLTGASGFVGSWLLASVLRANDEFGLDVVVVALTRDPDRFFRDQPDLAGHPSVRALGGDMVDFDFPEGRFQFVIHAATEQSFEPDSDRPLGAFTADVDGTRRVLDFARMHGVRRFLFTSSGAVYGVQPSEMTHVPEDYAGAPSTTDTRSAYGQAKRVSEFLCTMYGRAYGFDALIGRLFAFVGPRLPLDANFAVGNFIRDVLTGGSVRIAGDGTPYRSYLYTADLAIWLWTILLRGKAAYPYNVGSPHDLTIEDLARTVVAVTGRRSTIEIAKRPTAGSRPQRYVPSVERAQTDLGLRHLVSIEEGIKRTFDWHRMRDGGNTLA